MISSVENSAQSRQVRISRTERRTVEAVLDVPRSVSEDDLQEIASLAACSGRMLVTAEEVLGQTVEDAESTAVIDVQRQEAFDTPCDELWQGGLPPHFLKAEFSGTSPGWEIAPVNSVLGDTFGLDQCSPRQLRRLLHRHVILHNFDAEMHSEFLDARMDDGVVRPGVIYRRDGWVVGMAVAPDGVTVSRFGSSTADAWTADGIDFGAADESATVRLGGPWFVVDVIDMLCDAGLYLSDSCENVDGLAGNSLSNPPVDGVQPALANRMEPIEPLRSPGVLQQATAATS